MSEIFTALEHKITIICLWECERVVEHSLWLKDNLPSVEVFGFHNSLLSPHSVLDQTHRPHSGIFRCSEMEDGAMSERIASQDIFALQPKCKWQSITTIIITAVLCIMINNLLPATVNWTPVLISSFAYLCCGNESLL